MNTLETIIKRAKRGLGLSSRSRVTRLLRPGYDVLLNLLYRSRGLERRILGEPILLLPSYRSISEYAEARVFAAIKPRIRTGDVVLDVGANIGVFSLVMARWVGETGRVFAFEPAPESLLGLRRHIELNEVSGRIEAIGCAVSDTVGEAMFYAHTFNGENTLSNSFARR